MIFNKISYTCYTTHQADTVNELMVKCTSLLIFKNKKVMGFDA